MTKSQFKDSIRNIKKNFVSYISILLITMLSIATYMGVSSAAVNLENGANDYYKDSNFYDIELISTLLLSEDDIETLRGMDCVESVAPFYYSVAGAENKGEKENVNIISDTDDISVKKIVEGKEPSQDNECMIEDRLAESMKYKVGDTIEIHGSDGADVAYVKGSSFVITGIFQTPLHIKPSVKENSYMVIRDSAFDLDKLDGCYMRAYIRIKDRGNGKVFSEDYIEKVDKAIKEIEAISKERCDLRLAGIREHYQAELDKHEKELSDAESKLDAVSASITDAESELDEGSKKLEDSSKELEELKKKLDEGKKKLTSSKSELDKSKATLDSSKKTLDNARAELDAKKIELDDGKAALDSADKEITENEAKLVSAEAELSSAETELSEGKKKLDDVKSELESTFNEVESWKTSTRAKVKGILSKVMDIAGVDVPVNWSSEITDVDVSTASIETFNITDNLQINLLSDDIGTVIEKVFDSVGISKYYDPDRYEEIEALVKAYLDSLGIDRAEWREKVNTYRGQLNQWNKGRQDYVEGLSTYNSSYATYQQKLEEYNTGKTKVEEARAEWNKKKSTYDEGLAAYNSAEQDYQAGLSKYQSYKMLWDEKNAQYKKGLKDYNTGQKTYDDGTGKYDEGLKKLADAEAELKEKKGQYEDGLKQFEDGKKKLEDMKAGLDSLGECSWFATGIEANVGYKHMGMTIDGLQNLGDNFTILFVVLAALIIYATIARIISEQHKLVGTTKAFGFYVKEILSKYMLFGMSGLLVGYLLGLPLSYGFEKFALKVFVKNYVLETPEAKPIYSIMLLVLVAGIIITGAAVLFATITLLRKPAVELLRETSPKGAKGESRSKHLLPLFERLIFRNIVSDKLRIIVTIAGVAGCAALINIGFTMKFDFAKTESVEYDERVRYDLDITYDTDVKDSTLEDAENIYKKYGAEYANCMSYYSTFKTSKGSEIVEIVVTDTQTLQGFYKFTNPDEPEGVRLVKEGVYLKTGYADAYGFDVGDEITIMNKNGEEGQVVVAGLYENYVGQKLYMDNEYYTKVFSKDPEYNACMVKCDADKKASLKSDLEGCSYVHKAEASDVERDEFKKYVKSMDSLLVLILFFAVLMAAIIISNITFMYVMQKKLEILVMRINGYTLKEVRTYLLRESIMTTLLGLVIGLLGGSILASNIIGAFEKPHLQLYKSFNLKAWLMAGLVTVLFSLIINMFALKRVKKMQMTDIANVK